MTLGQYFCDCRTNINEISRVRLISQYPHSILPPKISKECLFLNLEDGPSGCITCASTHQWLTSYLIDHLKQHLATYTEVITNKEGKTAKVRIYYEQAFQLLKIGAYKPPYIIQFSHLTPRLQTELDQLDDIDLIYVLKQAVSRIFENINLNLYHNSISRVLRVVLQR